LPLTLPEVHWSIHHSFAHKFVSLMVALLSSYPSECPWLDHGWGSCPELACLSWWCECFARFLGRRLSWVGAHLSVAFACQPHKRACAHARSLRIDVSCIEDRTGRIVSEQREPQIWILAVEPVLLAHDEWCFFSGLQLGFRFFDTSGMAHHPRVRFPGGSHRSTLRMLTCTWCRSWMMGHVVCSTPSAALSCTSAPTSYMARASPFSRNRAFLLPE
jgi:hypothetical protein